jgi:hypothetical protein
MSLLQQIQESAIDGSTPLPTLLRQCKLLAARLGNLEFSAWVDSELNGYNSADNLPSYRKVKVNSKGHFAGSCGSEIRNAYIPRSCIDENFRESLQYCHFMQSAASMEYLVLSDKRKAGGVQEIWPPDLVVHVGENIYKDYHCVQAWKEIPMPMVIAAVDAIRSRILGFVIEIEAENPLAGDSHISLNPLSQERVTQIFLTNIAGNVGNVATGSSNFSQSADLSVNKNDFESLANYLHGHQIEDSDIQELRTAIKDDASLGHESEMGPNKMGWISSMYNKARQGASKIGNSVIIKVLTDGINSYLGI